MDLPSVLGGLAQGFTDFGKSVVDLFGTGGAAIGDLLQGTGTRNQDDFRKWLYNTNSVQDAAAKGLGTALNGVQTVSDYIPGIGAVTRNPLFNAAQGALGGLADEFKMNGENYDLGRAGQRAAVSGAAALAGSSLGDALKKSANPLLQSGLAQGLARGAAGGAINQGGYAAIDGGDVWNSALQGAGMGALLGGATGAMQDFRPRKLTPAEMALTDEEKALRIANAQKQIEDIGPIRRFTDDPNELAKRARVNELQDVIKAYQSGYDSVDDYNAAMAAKRANKRQSTTATTGTQQAQDYMMAHRPTQSGAYGYDITAGGDDAIMPADAYNNLSRYTGFTEPKYLDETVAQLNAARNNPDAEMTIYRATPGDAINDGDWITLSRAYADNHNNTQLGGKGNILEQRVPARDIQFAGDDLMEWGYYPQGKTLDATLADADMAVNSAKLTPEQEAYFKDSVIRDENGNLMPMYHGTPDGSFTVFNEGSYFTPNKEYADGYQWEGASVLRSNKKAVNPKTFEVYIDSKKPFTLSDPKARDIYLNEYIKGGNSMYYDPYSDWTKAVNDLQEVDWTEGEDLRAWLKENHPEYDALYLDEGGDGGYGEAEYKWRGKSLIPFESNQIKDRNNLKPTSDVDIMASRMTPDEMDLARALAGQDMAVNSAKIAPGQLGLFDDLPTQMPKTTGRQVSLFDQPQEGLDYYGGDVETPVIEPTNPYAPVNGQITQVMQDRAADVLKNWKKNGVPENELYNAINPDTLPAAIKGAKKLDIDGLKSITKDIFGVDDIKKADMGKVVQYAFSDEPNLARYYMGYIQNESPKSSLYKRVRKSAIEAANEKMTGEMVKQLLDSETIGSDNLLEIKRYTPSDHAVRSGYTAAADEVLSERLGIAPGNTPKYNGPMDTRRAYGRYNHPLYGPGGDLAIFERKMDSPEDAVSTIAHERLHSFQGESESRSLNNNRYSKEVTDAYNELHDALKDHYKTWEETAERYGRGDTAYWQRTKEQEARMLQNYLENKGYVKAPQMADKYRAGEWGNEINPAFDKFFDKLRDLSKRGVALPALAGLLGGGVVLDQVLNSKDSDKDKKKTKRSA